MANPLSSAPRHWQVVENIASNPLHNNRHLAIALQELRDQVKALQEFDPKPNCLAIPDSSTAPCRIERGSGLKAVCTACGESKSLDSFWQWRPLSFDEARRSLMAGCDCPQTAKICLQSTTGSPVDTSEEEFLLQKLRDLQYRYEEAAEPIVKRITAIRATQQFSSARQDSRPVSKTTQPSSRLCARRA
jgi:hypothetical protein